MNELTNEELLAKCEELLDLVREFSAAYNETLQRLTEAESCLATPVDFMKIADYMDKYQLDTLG